jgi:hypothetical protein
MSDETICRREQCEHNCYENDVPKPRELHNLTDIDGIIPSNSPLSWGTVR